MRTDTHIFLIVLSQLIPTASQMQVEEQSMRDEYPAPEEVKKEGGIEETVQTEEINRDNVDEEMNYAVDEEHSDDICEYLEDDVYPDADVYIGK